MGFKFLAAKMLSGVLQTTISLLGERFSYLFVEKFSVNFFKTVIIEDTSIHFYCPNNNSLWRVQTLFEKEPETIGWINSFEQNSVLWDIGANVGIYSLYSAKVKKNKVVSYEPFAGNFHILCKNVEINRLQGGIIPLCVALSNETKLDFLNLTSTEIGSALSRFGEANNNCQDPKWLSRQACIGFNVDNIIDLFQLPFPNYIKIDVDGIEDLIVKGAEKVLSDTRLESVLIELDDKDNEQMNFVSEIMDKYGFFCRWKKHSPMFDGGPYDSVYNHLFVRNNKGQ